MSRPRYQFPIGPCGHCNNTGSYLVARYNRLGEHYTERKLCVFCPTNSEPASSQSALKNVHPPEKH